jgi:hypothetical protein
MKPREKKLGLHRYEDFLDLGISTEWVPVIGENGL